MTSTPAQRAAHNRALVNRETAAALYRHDVGCAFRAAVTDNEDRYEIVAYHLNRAVAWEVERAHWDHVVRSTAYAAMHFEAVAS